MPTPTKHPLASASIMATQVSDPNPSVNTKPAADKTQTTETGTGTTRYGKGKAGVPLTTTSGPTSPIVSIHRHQYHLFAPSHEIVYLTDPTTGKTVRTNMAPAEYNTSLLQQAETNQYVAAATSGDYSQVIQTYGQQNQQNPVSILSPAEQGVQTGSSVTPTQGAGASFPNLGSLLGGSGSWITLIIIAVIVIVIIVVVTR